MKNVIIPIIGEKPVWVIKDKTAVYVIGISANHIVVDGDVGENPSERKSLTANGITCSGSGWREKIGEICLFLFLTGVSFTFCSSTGATFTFHWKLSSFYHPINQAIPTALDNNGEINVQLLFNIHTVFDSAVLQQLSCTFDLIVLSICIVPLQARAVEHLCG